MSELSKGYARRLTLALALITPHPVQLMDEPFESLSDLRARAGISSGGLEEVFLALT
ncbi:hypothetical protein [Mesorhizobium sp. M0520]|uniref:hypothetical protein n=1 Tax=Mesorhizobium sp. M0520 TaxID=2956957 RepID=UPI003336FA91